MFLDKGRNIEIFKNPSTFPILYELPQSMNG